MLNSDYDKIYSDYQMLLIVAPLGFGEDIDNCKLAIAVVKQQV